MPQMVDTSSMITKISEQTTHDVDNHINIENNFAIDHVQDYNDLVTRLRNDRKFERMIQDITLGRINGKGMYTKYSYSWGKD